MTKSTAMRYDERPLLVYWEMTRACGLSCRHCRAEARPWRDPCELSTEQGMALLNEVRRFGRILFVLTGGDPLYRPDIYDVIRHGTEIGLRMTMTPSGTKLVRKAMVRRMKDEGLSRLAVSLDGHNRETHDGFRGVAGSFAWTMRCIRWAREVGLEVQVNTTVTRFNQHHIREIGEMLRAEGIRLWSVFFLVPVGRGLKHDMASPAMHEELFHLLYDMGREMPYDIKTTAAQHYRRVVLKGPRMSAHGGFTEARRKRPCRSAPLPTPFQTGSPWASAGRRKASMTETASYSSATRERSSQAASSPFPRGTGGSAASSRSTGNRRFSKTSAGPPR